MSKPKVLFSSHTANFSKFNRALMRWFAQQGYEVHYASAGEEKILDCDRHFKVSFRRSPFSIKNIIAIFQLRAVINKNDYEIIHTHTPMGSVVTRLAALKARKKGTRILYTAHGFHFFKGAPLLNWLIYYPIEKILAHYTDTLITINKEDFEISERKFNTKTCLIDGVGVNVDKFSAKLSVSKKKQIREKIGLSLDDFILIFPAELNANKNQQSLIKAMSQMTDLHNVKLVLPGAGPLEAKLRRQINRSGLGDRVRLLGYRGDIVDLVRASDIFVSSSKREGQGLSVVESMAAGIPAVVSDNRGHRSVVVDQTNGFLVPVDDEEAFVEKVRELYLSPDLLRRFGKNAKTMSKVYDTTNILDSMDSVYDLRGQVSGVSVIIPAYNAEDTILDSIRSVYAQDDFPELKEVIVIDDGSSDNTLSAVEGYIKRHKIENLKLISQKNSGPSSARNEGIKRSSGDWIAFLDADDQWVRGKMKKQIAFINRYKRIRLIASDTLKIKSTVGTQVSKNLYRYGVIRYFLQSRLSTPSVLVYKKDLEAAGMFDVGMKYAEDQNLFMKIISKSAAYHVQLPLVRLSDKAAYGVRGLSANLSGMHDGVVRNIDILKDAGEIGVASKSLLTIAERVKYGLRVVRTRMSKG